MLALKEKELTDFDLEEEVYTKKSRVMPSRASYYSNTKESNAYVQEEKDDYSVQFIRGGHPVNTAVKYAQELDIDVAEQTDLKEYEQLRPELMPSATTMGAVKNEYYQEENEAEVVNFKVNKKGLVMLMVYAAIIMAIFTLIIVNAVNLVNLTNSASALEQQLIQENAAIASLINDIDEASDPSALEEKAKELGMGPIDDSGNLVLETTQIAATPDYEKSTNVFDWVVDNVFGGGY